MSSNILFVFEGKRTEEKMVNSLGKYILKESPIIKCAYAGDIYQFYEKISIDEDLDTFNLVKERDSENLDRLKDYNRGDFAEIYFFFDYDGHSSLASKKDDDGNIIKPGDDKIAEILSFFDNETDKGKLYISYPMVEALRHIVDFKTFKELKVKCKGNYCPNKSKCKDIETCEKEPCYKDRVSKESIAHLCNINGYTHETWKNLIKAHLFKMNYIVNDTYEFPDGIESQLTIFTKQLDKYINKQCPKVCVLSAFPIFVYDYYGNEKTKCYVNRTIVSIETKSLLIREIIPSDINVLLSVYSQEENMKYISNGKYDWTIEELRKKYQKVNNSGYPQGYGIFAVVVDGEVIGEAGLFNSYEDDKVLELGYIINEKFWNKGYGTKICKALLDYGFNKLNLEKIVARMHPENIGSIRICEKLNFVKIDVTGAIYYQYEISGL